MSQNQLLTERAYGLIRHRILTGQLGLGASISRKELALELGMSTLPISDALQRLKSEALVESVHRVGTRVRVPTPQDIRGFYIVREALESQAARLFCVNASQADQKELIALANRLDTAYIACAETPNASAQQLYDLRDQHMRFHLRVAEGSGCPFLCEALEKNQILTFNWFLDRLFGYPGLPENWHADLAAVLTVPDPEAADKAMRKHVRYRMDELLVRLEPFYSLNGLSLAKAMKEIHPAIDDPSALVFTSGGNNGAASGP